jgi:ADP-heptose:LPS heptosyltransferase
LCGARVIVSKHILDDSLQHEQVAYEEEQVIWKRNKRIVECVTGKVVEAGFPALHFDVDSPPYSNYIHVHPVGSAPQKSYPAKKLISLLEKLKNRQVVLTMTPKESVWYVSEELEAFLKENDNVRMIIKNFPFREIAGIISHADVFCTVNTGVLWLGLMLGQKIVVCDTFTDFEWNPKPYNNVIRLAHDYDEEGNSLHLVVREYPEGRYFSSMYLVSPEEIFEAITGAR